MNKNSIFAALLLASSLAAGDVTSLRAPGLASFKDLRPITIETGALQSAAETHRVTVPTIDVESIPAFKTADDGTRFTAMRLAVKGAAGLRLNFTSFHLPPSAKLYVFGLDAQGDVTSVHGPWLSSGPSNSGEFWTPATRGEEIAIEIQTNGDFDGDLPFSVASIEALGEYIDDPEVVKGSSRLQSVASKDKEFRSGVYKGKPVRFEVIEGKAIYEGDIILGAADDISSAQASGLKGQSHSSVAVTGSYWRWPGGVIPYVIDTALPNPARITTAISHWNTKLSGSISIVPRTTQANYVRITRWNEAYVCASDVGMIGGVQHIVLGDYCDAVTIIHEIGHTAGLFHEQSREDRDGYVRILYENIDPNYVSNFDKAISYADDVGAYDYASIMHYSGWTFSMNGLPTIETIPAGIPIGQTSALSAGDVAGARTIYPSTTTPLPSTIIATITTNPVGPALTVDGLSIAPPKTYTWVTGERHSLAAPGLVQQNGTRYSFVSWSNGGTQSQTITVPAVNTSYTAHFATQYQVVASVAPAGSGTVSMSQSSADGYYAAGSVIGLSAAPIAGYCFGGWSGLIAGTPANTQITITKPYTVTANMVTGASGLSVTSNSVPSGGGSYAVGVTAGAACTWTATSPVAWITLGASSGQGSANLAYTVAVNAGSSSRSGVITIGGRTLTVTQAGASSTVVSVTITSSPAGRTLTVDGVAVLTPAIVSWRAGTQHVLSAPAIVAQNGTRYIFRSWSNGGAATQTITVPSIPTTYTAVFATQYKVTASVVPAGSGTVSITPTSTDGYYSGSSTISLSAVSIAGYCFGAWTGLPSGTAANTQLVVTKPYTLTATMATGVSALSQSTASIPNTGGTFNVGVSAGAGCGWTASTSVDWIHLAAVSGQGSISLSYSVRVNNSRNGRAGTIYVGGKTLVVNQSGRLRY